MGLFGRKRGPEVAAVTLGEAWQTLAPPLGGIVEVRGERSVHVVGRHRGRPVEVDIEADGVGVTGVLRMAFGETRNKRKAYRDWHTSLVVSCSPVATAQGAIRSYVDLDDPSWKPGQYDPNAGRRIVAEPASIGGTVLTDAIRGKLMDIATDVVVTITADAVRIDQVDSVPEDRGYLGASVIHWYPGPVQQMPASATAGPPWWIDLLCDIADLAEAR